MTDRHTIKEMATQMAEEGLTQAQEQRLTTVHAAATRAVFAVLQARYGVSKAELQATMDHSANINAQFRSEVEALELSPEYVAYVHSGGDY